MNEAEKKYIIENLIEYSKTEKIEKNYILENFKKYDLEKLSIKQAELIEIAHKYAFYAKRCICWYLIPFYMAVLVLSAFIAEKEAYCAKKVKRLQD